MSFLQIERRVPIYPVMHPIPANILPYRPMIEKVSKFELLNSLCRVLYFHNCCISRTLMQDIKMLSLYAKI
jgi:hypothetical protein